MNISDYTYPLPQEKIAKYPLPDRDASKLLVYRNGQIAHSAFRALASHLPPEAFLFFNNTKVIPARLHFRKESGAAIEVFLLNPVLPSPILALTMTATRTCTWECTIGNLKKWPSETVLQRKAGDIVLTAVLEDRSKGLVKFTWDSEESFAEIIRQCGETPLPPYLHRKAEAADRERYQTIYSLTDGAVAAPTAGLHFTPAVFQQLKEKDIQHDFVTLHVSAGTFQPIKTEDPAAHIMHEEQIIITRGNLENLMKRGRMIVAVGTTSMRTLESVYWFGAKLLADPQSTFHISQTDAGTLSPPPADEALRAVLRYMDMQQTDSLVGETSIYITPGYRFRICQGLITNFHQPASTLILLVAAFVGKDWRKIYEEALEGDYRFLSYGDSSLLFGS